MKQAKIIKVAKVKDSFTAVLNYGSEDGAKINQKFLIYSIGDEIFDPDTQESLGHLEIVKGTGVVTNVQPKMCTVSSASYTKPRSIITRNANNGFASVFGNSETIERTEPEQLPFDGICVSDLAKRIE